MMRPGHLISEKAFKSTVRDLAEGLGWVCFTTWDSRHSPAGEPDLRLVHPDQKRMIWIELKSERGRLTQKQKEAIDVLRQAGEVVYVFRPSQWEDVVMNLTAKAGGLSLDR